MGVLTMSRSVVVDSSTANSSNAAVPKLMNTFRLDPKNRFNPTKVHAILEEVVNRHCHGEKYDCSLGSAKVQAVAGEILQEVKKLNFDRYRLVVFVQIGTNNRQDFETAVRFLWDMPRDAFAIYTLRSASTFTSAICYGIYKD